MIRALLRALADAAGLAGATMQRAVPDHADFVNLPFRLSDHVVLLEHGVAGTVVARWEDPGMVEDAYVVMGDEGQVLVAPESGMRLRLGQNS